MLASQIKIQKSFLGFLWEEKDLVTILTSMLLLVFAKIFLIIKTTPENCCKEVLEERVMLILWKLLIEKHRDLRILFGIARNNELCETPKLRKFWEDSIYIYLVRSMLNNKCQTYFCMVLGNLKDSVCIFEDVFHIIFWKLVSTHVKKIRYKILWIRRNHMKKCTKNRSLRDLTTL